MAGTRKADPATSVIVPLSVPETGTTKNIQDDPAAIAADLSLEERSVFKKVLDLKSEHQIAAELHKKPAEIPAIFAVALWKLHQGYVSLLQDSPGSSGRPPSQG